MRGLAALAVVFDHGFPLTSDETSLLAVWSPGAVGVRLFFVLSGFLITDILMRARGQAAASGVPMWQVWRAFMVRRILRIVPLAYLALGVAWVTGVPGARNHLWWYLSYLANFRMALWPNEDHGNLVHFWTLAIEEQFYVLWPVLLLAMPVRTWRPLIVGTLFAVPIGRVITADFIGWWHAYTVTWTRVDALALGGLLAIVRPPTERVVVMAAGLGLPGLFVPRDYGWMSMQESAAIWASAALVVAVARGTAAAALSARPLVYIGTISYGLYVWHLLVPELVPVPVDGGPARFALLLGGGLLLAMGSWHLVERPLNSLKERWPYVPRPVISARCALRCR